MARLAVREASTYMRITLGEHYRQMRLNALPAGLKRNYAARGSPECARYLARIDKPPKTLRRSAVPPGGEHMKVDLTGGRFDAVLFDLDGVLTDTARIHEASWKKMFDAFLRQRAKATGEPFRPSKGRTRREHTRQ